LSSGSKEVDSLINECNNIKEYNSFEWIPFERFTNVEYLAKGGFGSIYKATWLDGPLEYPPPLNGIMKRINGKDRENVKLC